MKRSFLLCLSLLVSWLATPLDGAVGGIIGGTASGARLRNVVYAQEGANLYQLRTAVPADTTIVVGPGLYETGVTNLFRTNLNWHFMAGSKIKLIDIPTNTTGAGIFDDRFSGAITTLITGTLDIEYSNGTNVWYDPMTCAMGFNTNALGPIVVTNALSHVRMLGHWRVGHYGFNKATSALTVLNCQTNSIFSNFDEIYDLYPTDAHIIDFTFFCFAPTTTTAIKWDQGDCAVTWSIIKPHSLYALECYNTTTNPASMYLRGDLVDGKAYIVGYTNDYKVWCEVLEWRNSSTQNQAWNMFGAGNHYLRAEKISTTTGPVFRMENPADDPLLQLWVDIDKVSSHTGFIDMRHGQFRGRIGHFEQDAAMTVDGIICTNATSLISLSGERITTDRVAVVHGGGRTELNGYRIYSTNRDPVLVTGSGLRLNDCVLWVGTGATNCIRAASAQTVHAFASYGKSNAHANVTQAITGGLTIDTDID